MKIPRIIHQIWFDGKPPAPMSSWLQAWKDLHPQWTVKLWTQGSSEDVIVCGDEKCTCPYPDLVAKAANSAQRSNLFRLTVLLEQGGVYVDTDTEPLRNIEPIFGEAEALATPFYNNSGPGLNNSFLAAVPHHPWIQDLILNLPNKDPTIPMSMGPRFVTEITSKHKEVTILDELSILQWPLYHRLAKRRPFDLSKTYAVHHFFSIHMPKLVGVTENG